MTPEWRDIDGYPAYQVSDLGEVRSFKQIIPRVLVPQRKPNGYLFVWLYDGEERVQRYVHRLVALAFVGGHSKRRDQVNHKDKNRRNNCAANLEWVTSQENSEHRESMRWNPKCISRNRKTRWDVEEILEDLRAMSYKEVARKHRISESWVGAIARGKAWRIVPRI